MDDIWTAEEVPAGREARYGPTWLRKTDKCWEELGVQSHPDKVIDGEANQEVQGTIIHDRYHWVGVSSRKRL